MKIYTLRCQMQAPVSMRDAFAVFEDPRNLSKITPPWLGFNLLNPNDAMCKDAFFNYTIRWMHLPWRWKTRISEYEPPFFFTDEMVRGPYAMWIHRHRFHPTVDGTLVTDEVDYALPLGILGTLAHRILVADQLKEIFRYRQLALNEMMCGGRAKWTDPVIIEKPPQSPPSGTANPETRKHVVS
jgi:ligand-binding SRPBCC domain-containing protein